jgi:hypothetical protein
MPINVVDYSLGIAKVTNGIATWRVVGALWLRVPAKLRKRGKSGKK